MEFRVGIGFDAHGLAEGRRLVLGGVTIPYHLGLAGHSDGDVLIHAIMDALLGAASLGDKGEHFPSSDPQYKNITMLAQRPRLGPFISAMKEQTSAALSVAPERVSIKVTTTDYLGFVGREEGIAACAVASIVAKL
jgi:2-C-methyl-D-erythritol 2,4-cyclodiphosphate synthase